jgi:hypothetical protein
MILELELELNEIATANVAEPALADPCGGMLHPLLPRNPVALHPSDRQIPSHHCLDTLRTLVPLEIYKEAPTQTLSISSSLSATEEALALKRALRHKLEHQRLLVPVLGDYPLPVGAQLRLDNSRDVCVEIAHAPRRGARKATPHQALNLDGHVVQPHQSRAAQRSDNTSLDDDSGIVPPQYMPDQRASSVALNQRGSTVQPTTADMVSSPSRLDRGRANA